MRASESSGTAARFSPRAFAGFAWYARRYLARHFDAVRIGRGAPALDLTGRPVVVAANHPSWWDPMLFLFLHDQWFPGRPSYGPMDAAALEKYRLFESLGAYGVERGTLRGAARFLEVTRALLDRPESVVWITAQGEFEDPRDRPVRLRRGLAHAVAGRPGVAVVPLALEYPFWDERAPQALGRTGTTLSWSPGERPQAFARRVEVELESTMDRLALDARSRDPQRFDTLLLGRSGVGGVYDRIRAFRAILRGRRFDPSHGGGRRA